jgi:hypothetical protein
MLAADNIEVRFVGLLDPSLGSKASKALEKKKFLDQRTPLQTNVKDVAVIIRTGKKDTLLGTPHLVFAKQAPHEHWVGFVQRVKSPSGWKVWSTSVSHHDTGFAIQIGQELYERAKGAGVPLAKNPFLKTSPEVYLFPRGLIEGMNRIQKGQEIYGSW